MRIGVFGDSYADRQSDPMVEKIRTDESWMAYINSKGHKITSYGLSGSASWHAFCNFKNFYKQFDHIVFCWSSPHRMQTMPLKYATQSSIKDVEQFYAAGRYRNWNAEEQTQIVQMILGYQYLCDFNFNMWVQQKMFDEVNLICKEKNIKLVNILPFVTKTDNEVDFSKRSGDCLFRLFEVTKKELDIGSIPDIRSTHLSKENNAVLGEIILERFEKGENILIDLYKQVDFVYSTEISNRYHEYGRLWAELIGVNKSQ